MKETKLLKIQNISNDERVIGRWNRQDAQTRVIDHPQIQAELDRYLAEGWQLVGMTPSFHDLYFLLTR